MTGLQPRRFLLRIGLCGVLLFLPIVALNVAMDPYGLFMRPKTLLGDCTGGFRAGGLDPVQLALDRTVPDIVLTGNSRVWRGHDTADPALKSLGSRAFNFAWPAAEFSNVRQRLERAAAGNHPRAVVLGLGIGDLLARVVSDAEMHPAPRWRTYVSGLIGWTAAVASARALAQPGACARPQRSFAGDDGTALASDAPMPDSAAAIRASDRYFARSYAYAAARLRESTQGAPHEEAAVELSRLLHSLCRRGTRVVVFFEPVHVRLLEVMWQTGTWRAAEEIKRHVSLEIARVRGAGCDAQLWDFTAYNAYTTGVYLSPAAPGYFYESSHYTLELGRLVTRTMLAGASDESFGRTLDPSNVEERLRAVRAERERYIAGHPEVTQFARELLATIPPRALRARADATPR